MNKQVYIGNPASVRKKLIKGKTAIVLPAKESGFVVAQFDDRSTGLGYGWHRFPAAHFADVPPARLHPMG